MATSFQRIVSSDDDSDFSEDNGVVSNNTDGALAVALNDPSGTNQQTTTTEQVVGAVKASRKLAIVENGKNLNKKFSIWSEILMEEELNESMNKSLKLKRRLKRKRAQVEKESDNYSFWTKQDFDRKFAVKKSNAVKRKLKSAELKKDIVSEISRKLNESRVDIIRKIVQVIGEEKSRKLTAEVLDIESAGGMMTADGNRRRSPGGVLFFIIKNDSTISADQKRDIFCDNIVKQGNKLAKEKKKAKHKPSGSSGGGSKGKNKKSKKKKKAKKK